jgi:hypothetical protein
LIGCLVTRRVHRLIARNVSGRILTRLIKGLTRVGCLIRCLVTGLRSVRSLVCGSGLIRRLIRCCLISCLVLGARLVGRLVLCLI